MELWKVRIDQYCGFVSYQAAAAEKQQLIMIMMMMMMMTITQAFWKRFYRDYGKRNVEDANDNDDDDDDDDDDHTGFLKEILLKQTSKGCTFDSRSKCFSQLVSLRWPISSPVWRCSRSIIYSFSTDGLLRFGDKAKRKDSWLQRRYVSNDIKLVIIIMRKIWIMVPCWRR